MKTKRCVCFVFVLEHCGPQVLGSGIRVSRAGRQLPVWPGPRNREFIQSKQGRYPPPPKFFRKQFHCSFWASRSGEIGSERGQIKTCTFLYVFLAVTAASCYSPGTLQGFSP